MTAATKFEEFVLTLLERLAAMLWNEFQTWIEKPGNFEIGLAYIDEILTSIGIAVAPVPVPGAPNVGTSAAAAPAAVQSLDTVTAGWFAGHQPAAG